MKKIGLALGGGGVLGAAHVGALNALEEHNVEIEYISGTSIGAFVAAFYAFGYKSDKIKEIASELEWLDISQVSLSRYGLLSNKKLGELIVKHLDHKKIEDAEIPLAIVTTDLLTGEKVVFDKGSIADAVMASMSVPGIFQPIELDGKILVDGGVSENLPARTVKDMGANYVVSIDLNSKRSYQKPNNIIDVIISSLSLLIKTSDQFQTEVTDLMIQPDLSKYNRSDMNQINELIKEGYEEAKKDLEENL